MTYETFITQFQEFASADAALVRAHLAAADLRIDRSVWRDKADQGQAYLAAHTLALSPFGQSVRIITKDGTTTYYSLYNTMVHEVASGFRVI